MRKYDITFMGTTQVVRAHIYADTILDAMVRTMMDGIAMKNIMSVSESREELNALGLPADQLKAALEARATVNRTKLDAPSAAVIPPGWKLVPIEPTPDMRLAAQDAFPRSASFVFPMLWDAMLAASPTPPATTPAKLKD